MGYPEENDHEGSNKFIPDTTCTPPQHDRLALARAVKDAAGGARGLMSRAEFQPEEMEEAWLDKNTLVRVGTVKPDLDEGDNELLPFVAIYHFG